MSCESVNNNNDNNINNDDDDDDDSSSFTRSLPLWATPACHGVRLVVSCGTHTTP